ncbi:MAG: YceI family protein [Bacteroidales bacterium]|nr:YceI family protein [Bacteroidales bacterium]
MRFIFLISFSFILTINLFGQEKYFTRNGHIYFISRTAAIDIDANNHQVGSIINIKTGEMVFSVLMKSFEFELALAEDHFNEDYVESDRFPKSKFKGKILNFNEMDLTKNGNYNVEVEGELSLHGKVKTIIKSGTLLVENGKITGKSEFTIFLDDFDIKVPNMVKDKVAKEIEIKLNLTYEPYNK